jgi:hypothetical protein
MPPPRALIAVCTALAIAGMARIVFVDAQTSTIPSRIDDRYVGIRPLVPHDGRARFLTDERFARELDSKRYTQTLYSLAPLVLTLDDADAGLAVADVVDPKAVAGLAADGGFDVLWVAPSSVLALFQRRGGP